MEGSGETVARSAPPGLDSRSLIRRRGFTLLEVLISIMILVLAVSSILPLFAVAGTSHKRGIDQAHLAWLAPRVAARVQEQFYDAKPKEIEGYIRELADGSLLVDNIGKRLDGKAGATYTFFATFTPVSRSGQGDLAANTAFHLDVEVNYLEAGADQAEKFHTIVLRKLLR